MAITIDGVVFLRRDTKANWEHVNPILGDGEPGYDTTIKNFKFGDGITHWTSLDYWIGGPGGQITTPIVGGVTNNPITVSHAPIINPSLIFRNADGSNYGGAVNNVDNGTTIVLTGDYNGSGKFADSFSFIIKP